MLALVVFALEWSKQGYRDAIQFAISEINESADNFLIDEKEADRINENLKTILRKVYQND
ncbi:hypothetical protein SAG0055_02530 [Streptococcus agalactiae CCUG 29376]|uniref:Uncharacterized protein n=1 Tax=Streptococcus agalactiae CCUG 29376 TaxID=1105255 RepID=A0AAV3JIR8_STRAG|nr:hypothetical protein B1H24_09945 [Streptococcus agalactiae]EPU53686.1 hypothetical protein SAG0301_03840 [Streptococcus agalactiae GB00003]EPU83878.1 hypothetical protein SAG0316_03545 [Streptococcus agalactiae GB00206]EPV11935.1 hypothetical protein SAG0330_04155 [Streptococcus agalactiae GB00561]EPV29941.1 hypothetical protein SAG0336_08915 [Streptococcus agalactiae GB00653]EPW15418.1 hypothetical protein SAG0055_02530 [Streptococcus agalactiae CCUG 29376]EPX23958.1 hypothetical protein 